MTTREENRRFLEGLTKDQLEDLLFTQIRNIWTVDGLYFLGIEEKHTTLEATAVDENVWKVMGKIEARRLKEVMGMKDNGMRSLAKALRCTSWFLDQENAVLVEERDRVSIRNLRCRVQTTRLGKGLPEFPCKGVRSEFFKAFAREFNPNVRVACKVCPPDKHPDDLWCEWEFSLGPD
jgi:hypothetical protein